MRFGVFIFLTEYAISPVELGKRLEDLGFDSLWLPEHTHIPVSRRTPFPGGGDLPREYSCTYDPFLTLTAVAQATETLLLGTGVCLLTERDPIVTAKEVATLDHFSGGRVQFGVGAGWNLEEMENHGADPGRRWKLLRERVEAMKAIWTQDEAEYHGELVDFDPIWQWPKPVQKPHPPIWLGSSTASALRRVVRYADGWMPSALAGVTDWRPLVDQLAELCDEAGRERPPISLYGVPPDPETITRHAQAGIDRCLFRIPSAPAAEVVPLLERLSSLRANVG